jgi:hypothetical protein
VLSVDCWRGGVKAVVRRRKGLYISTSVGYDRELFLQFVAGSKELAGLDVRFVVGPSSAGGRLLPVSSASEAADSQLPDGQRISQGRHEIRRPFTGLRQGPRPVCICAGPRPDDDVRSSPQRVTIRTSLGSGRDTNLRWNKTLARTTTNASAMAAARSSSLCESGALVLKSTLLPHTRTGPRPNKPAGPIPPHCMP